MLSNLNKKVFFNLSIRNGKSINYLIYKKNQRMYKYLAF